MEDITSYCIDVALYKATSGDFCVSVERYGKEPEHYNIGSEKDALAFILADYECE